MIKIICSWSVKTQNLIYLLLPCAILILVCAIFVGLKRIGFSLPLVPTQWLAFHGPWMVAGFLGILVGMERAAALQKAWMWGAPFFCALGALTLILPIIPIQISGAFFSLGAIFLIFIFIWIFKLQSNLFHFLMLLGAASFGIGNILWFSGSAFPQIVFFWMAFLLLTIAGERLELTRFRNPSSFSKLLLVTFNVLFLLGASLHYFQIPLSQYLLGSSLLGTAFWLLTQDMALQSLKAKGLTRYIAWSLMLGYGWLCVSGVLILLFGQQQAGWEYDAFLHSFFLGFVFSMIFGHAPLILPAVLKLKIKFNQRFYILLISLHFSIALRILGDITHILVLRKWGALLNGVVIILFFINMKLSSDKAA